MTATAIPTDERIHLAALLHPIEAVLLDRVTYGWEDDFYEQVIDPMTPWYPEGDETGETPLAAFVERVRDRAKRAALEAAVSEIVECLIDVPTEALEGHTQPVEQLRVDVALAAQGE